MSKQLLIYEKAVPLSKQTHGKWSVEVGDNFSFAKEVNSVPLMAVEIPFAAKEYPIVFVQSEDGNYMPTVVLGLQGHHNLFVSDKNQWEAKYQPAFIRRYPFVFAVSEDKATFTLCIDEAFSGFNKTGKGKKLFEKNGEASPYVTELLKFLQDYEAQFAHTRKFSADVDELELLEPVQAQVVSPAGETTRLTGFHCVNREKLANLPGKTLARLASSGELELIYLHLWSLRNFQEMNQRLSQNKVASPSDN